jgi:hypothetical protein
MLPDSEYPNNSTNPQLSPDHRRVLYKESAISPDVAAARGYRTIASTADVPEAFARWQRRRGLLVPNHSPDGETVGYQLRPDKPIKRKSGNTPKYETPARSRITLDVNPLMLNEVRYGGGDLWITEGCKKVDALASHGTPAVGIVGVYSFAVPGSKSETPLPCWSHVRLRGRRVIIGYDSDTRTNPNVQEALRRLVAMLEKMGATVLVVYIPAVNGDSKAGVDDCLAAGGTVEELRELARPFEPVDIGAERMGQDDRLRAAVADSARRWQELPANTRGECSDKDVAAWLIEAAPVRGKVVAGGIRVDMAWGTLEIGAKVSRRTVGKSLARLEERGFLTREPGDRRSGKSGAFVLRADVNHYGSDKVNREGREKKSGVSGLHLRAPRLRWSAPKWKPSRKTIAKYRRGEISRLPEIRPAIKRIGKNRGAILDALDLAGGSLTLRELANALQHKRPRDLVRRKATDKGRDGLLVWLVEDGIVTLDGDRVSLAPDWLERLGFAMWAGQEAEADQRQRHALKIRREAFHTRRKRNQGNRDKPANPASIGAVRQSRERRAEHFAAERRRREDQRETLPAPEPELVEALAKYLDHNPRRQEEQPSWLAVAMWAHEYLPDKPTPASVESALYELRREAA